jgi:peptide/nickel transport system substrate-binding protein/oligopeptide transport system substrate-binding protein
LRQGVKFHHGREVTAADFVYSFTRLLSTQQSIPVTEFFQRIQGAKDFVQGKTSHVWGLQAPDRYTLQIVLEEPCISSLAILALANAAVVPREEVERLGEGFARAPVGTGPFKFVQWEPTKEIVLEANEHYHEGRPFLDTIVFKIGVGGKLEERFAEFLKGNLEEAFIPGGKTDEIATDPQYQQYQFIRKPMLNVLYIGFNTQAKPFDDKRVRQAFNYVVDTKAIVQKITRSGSLPATGVFPPGMPGYDPTLRGYDYNPVKAK